MKKKTHQCKSQDTLWQKRLLKRKRLRWVKSSSLHTTWKYFKYLKTNPLRGWEFAGWAQLCSRGCSSPRHPSHLPNTSTRCGTLENAFSCKNHLLLPAVHLHCNLFETELAFSWCILFSAVYSRSLMPPRLNRQSRMLLSLCGRSSIMQGNFLPGNFQQQHAIQFLFLCLCDLYNINNK